MTFPEWGCTLPVRRQSAGLVRASVRDGYEYGVAELRCSKRRFLGPVKSTGKRVSYTMDSTLESVNRAEQLAEKTAAQFGFDEEERGRISIAVREAAVNAVLHGNQYDPNKKITLSFENTDEGMQISVADQGPGLNPDNLPDPLAPENLLKISGRGIFLIRAFMDEVHFRALNPGTELILIKRRGKAADAKEEKS